MILDLVGSVQPESVLRLPLDESVDKVGALDAPPGRDLAPLDLHLLSQDVVPDLLPALSHVGSLPRVTPQPLTLPIMHS